MTYLLNHACAKSLTLTKDSDIDQIAIVLDSLIVGAKYVASLNCRRTAGNGTITVNAGDKHVKTSGGDVEFTFTCTTTANKIWFNVPSDDSIFVISPDVTCCSESQYARLKQILEVNAHARFNGNTMPLSS